jgi:hypothetical protein
MAISGDTMAPPATTSILPPHTIMRPLFDRIWNAFGYARSGNYNDAGEWVGQR